MTVLILSLLACNDSTDIYDPRADWELDVPETFHISDPVLTGQITWKSDETVPDALLQHLITASDAWHQLMACGIQPMQFYPENGEENATQITFTCDQKKIPQLVDVFQTQDNNRYVHMDPGMCQHGQLDSASFAWAQGLGFEDQVGDGLADYLSNLNTRADIDNGVKMTDWTGLSADTLQIFALSRGAQGCSESEEHVWSWEQNGPAANTRIWRRHPSKDQIPCIVSMVSRSTDPAGARNIPWQNTCGPAVEESL